MLETCNLSVGGCCLFSCMVVRQWYREKRRDLGLGLCRGKTSEICWELGEKLSNAQIRELCGVTKGMVE